MRNIIIYFLGVVLSIQVGHSQSTSISSNSKIKLNQVLGIIRSDYLFYEFSDFYFKNIPVAQGGNSWINFSENKQGVSWFFKGHLFKGILRNPIANKIENKLELELNWKNKTNVGTQNALIYIEFYLDRIDSRWNTLIRLKILNSEMIAYLKLEKSKFEIVNNYINTNPEILYDNIYETHDSVRIVESEGKYGFIDNSGQKIVEMEYDCISPLKKDIFLVELNGKYGIIDNHGKIKVPIKYSFIENIDYKNLVSVSDDNNKIGFFDYYLGLEVISCQYEDVRYPEDGFLELKKAGKWGLFNYEGKQIIPCKCDEIETGKDLASCKSFSNEKFNLFDKNGKLISQNQFQDVILTRTYDMGYSVSLLDYPIVKINNKYGIIDKIGIPKLPCKYDELDSFKEGLAVFRLNDKYGFIDTNGVVVIPPKFEKTKPFTEGIAAVQLNGKLGFINKRGELIISNIYDTIPINDYHQIAIFRNGFTNVKLKNKSGLIDSNGRILLPFIYDHIFSEYIDSKEENNLTPQNKSKEIVWCVRKNKKMGIYNPKNKIIGLKYDFIGAFYDDLAEFWLNGKKGFLNKKGLIIIPAKFDKVGSFSNGLASVVLNGKVGYVNKQGKVVIPCIYDQTGQEGIEYYNFSNECSEVYLNNERFYINKKGRTISDCN
jgi:hypothetical protein